MNAKPYLEIIAAAFHHQRLDAVMIGNAAAAINGAPVTTLNIDFLVAALADIIRSKKAAGRPKDLASIPILELTLNEKNNTP